MHMHDEEQIRRLAGREKSDVGAELFTPRQHTNWQDRPLDVKKTRVRIYAYCLLKI
jgi:hypothetical protein